MTEQRRAKPEVWAAVERLCKNEMDMLNCTLELRSRVEALEGSATKGSDHFGEVNKMVPDGSLVERVAYAITGDDDGPINWKNEARAAIHEVAAWLRSKTDLVYGPQCARWLEDELKKPL